MMNYDEAFELAVAGNAGSGRPYFIYKMIWTNEYIASLWPLRGQLPTFMVLIGEVRRMTPR
ncbi:protein of unknown function [Magnetospirillum sp. XM-1]|uniref:hypothetical protein n=1 Tax=Magnetospirillum sp. XM-1 TaxID=1663591 RepID=UPI00073DDF37|nr:hypothetical protein [Magnetospirillum sp. XM-1]CUW38815.1 protein of unknown function [Magnetospirillum sp. XM-1]